MGSLVDSRIARKPDLVGNNRELWLDWRFDVENFTTLVDPQFADDMRIAALERGLVNDVQVDDPSIRRRSTSLYAFLCSITKEKSKQILRKLRDT